MMARAETEQEHGSAAPGKRRPVLSRLSRVVMVVPHALGAVRPILAGAGEPAADSVAGLRRRNRPVLTWLLPWLIAGFLAFTLLPLNVTLAVTEFDVLPLLAFVAGIAQSAALVLILLRPRVATALQFVAVAVFAVAIPPDSGSTWPLTVSGLFTLVAHIALVAAWAGRRMALVTWSASVLLLTVVALLDPRGRTLTDGLTMMILYPILSTLALGAVLMTRGWQEVRRELADARRDVEVEQSQRAVAEERTRIARELHDVVAHSMSVIHMQATSASYRIKDLDPESKAEFARIAAGARATMREMRQLLAVLRDESADPELTPVPGLGRLPELVESAGRAGVPVELREAEAVREAVLPESVALTAYRIVQESLSNVIRHAPGARTTIGLDLDELDLVLSVENDASAQPAQPMEAPGRAGHGLPGMRERVRLVGGSLQAGPRAEGGYRVLATLPIGGQE
ncbi:two-component sensor histidine kinase [Amorphoplanes auranticolor]|uniref:histidine kinase n=2 Tax=Actinoplanes auranticolor TaxID=47988 RepID=A0A919VI53_9ACTN|nr:two-component sensor histidine kinase [Actinoplanes auranticolor]